MEISSDPYEQKLYHMFRSHDTDSKGTLDETSLIKLCNSLELNDQGNLLINSLLINNNSRVTFKSFKEGLLKFLGTEMEKSEREKTLVITEDELINGAPDSPGREVSPKLIMGTKKYGRRSRPQSLVTDSSISDSDSETTAVVPNLNNSNNNNNNNKTQQKVQRSSSQSEIHGNRRRRPTSGNKLKRCASLPAQRNQKGRDPINRSKQQHTSSGTPGQNQLTSSVESLDMPLQFDIISANTIIEMWESAGIIDAKTLFLNLGFDEELIQISQLSNTLEEELRGLHSDSQTASLLKASLVLKKAEVSALQQAFRQLIDENKKLYADNRDANKRVAMLAQEIDERHANLEDTTKSEIRMLEQRHAEVIRELTSQLANDRENWSNLNVRLENRIKSLEIDETKLKTEFQIVQDENSALEQEQISLQKQITDLLTTNIKLNNEIVDLEDRQRNDDNGKSEKETEEVLELIDKITSLQFENANLRDKNDELAAEIEGLNFELSRCKNKKSSRTNLDTATDLVDDPETSSSLAMKRRGDSPSKTRITEESPRLGKLRKCSNENSESETSGDWVALNSELGTNINASNNNNTGGGTTTSGFSQDFSSLSESKEEEIKFLKERIILLEKEISDYKQLKVSSTGNDENNDITTIKVEKEKYESRCQDLDNSLEQMRRAYEDCEDYWQSKLNEERNLFEKERQIYEDEQQESDKKFTELMEKVREYEEQFSKDGRLSPIEEKDQLEQQYAELEAETEEIRENARTIFEEKTKEINQLQAQIQDLRKKLGENNELSSNAHLEPSENESPASSPISYLWNQSTIQAPARDYQNPVWNPNTKENGIDNLTPSETTIFSTSDSIKKEDETNITCNISPIQKPNSSNRNLSEHTKDSDDTASNASASDSQSVTSTQSINNKSSLPDSSNSPSPNLIKEELKRLKYVEYQLREQIKDLAHKRDSLVMELQQLQEAKPVLEKAYARAAHPTLLQRVNQLEQKNRHLQTVLRQQQQYTESIMHQTWQQQRGEISELRNRLETQGIIMTEQAQRLANADMLVKDLYVENSHLTATIQRLEQQRNRANLMHQHQGLSGVPGMP